MNVSQRDAEFVWHPYTQHFRSPQFPSIVGAHGNYLHLEDGRKVIDAISSWWVNLHGHSHPYIATCLGQTMADFQQVMFAGFTHSLAVDLSEKNHLSFGNGFLQGLLFRQRLHQRGSGTQDVLSVLV